MDLETTLVAAVATSLHELPAGAAVVLGCSGGPDSAGLLLLTSGARPDLRVTAVHVRHGLRDDGEDVEVAERQARAMGVEFVAVAVEVATAGEGIEAAARLARHAALQDVARTRGAAAVLVGHTLEDQAETVLMRLARGTSLRGAGGIRPWRAEIGGVPVGHPLLGLRRADVHALVAHAGIEVATDPSNVDPAFARNVVRADVLPALARHGGDPSAALARFARRAVEDDRHLRELAIAVLDGHAIRLSPDDHEDLVLPVDCVFDAPPAVGRRVIEEALARVRPDTGVVADEIDDILALSVDRCVDRRGVRVTRHGRTIRFAAAPRSDGCEPSPPATH